MSIAQQDRLTGDVLVIGAGPAGLASAHCLERLGISYVVVERTSEIASTWAHLYRSLRLNTASFVTYLPGRRMPPGTPIYPTGEQLYRYFLDYARGRSFNILLNVEVQQVRPSANGWEVETSLGTAVFKAVIVASGRYSSPIIPALEGMDDFRGVLMHAQRYRDPSPFAGKRVLAVGAGPSGVDIALELTQTAALPVFLSIRSDIVIARRYPWGLPDTAWHLIARSLLPRRWRTGFLNRVLYQSFPDADVLGVPLGRNRTDRRGSSTPVRGRALIDAVRAGQIRPVAGVARFWPDDVELMDGTRLQVDSVVFSTGYCPALDFLKFPFERDSQGYPRRHDTLDEGGSTELLDAPGIYLVGRYYRGLGPLHNLRQEAEMAAREIQARLAQHDQTCTASAIRSAAT